MFGFFKKEIKSVREWIDEGNLREALNEAEKMCFDPTTAQKGLAFIKEISDKGYLLATSTLCTIYKRGGFYGRTNSMGKQQFASLVNPNQETEICYQILEN